MNVIDQAPSKFANGTVRMVDQVTLPQREKDTEPRIMGVIWLEEENGTTKYTDFSSQHKVLELDKPARVVFQENLEVKEGDVAIKHRNIVAITQD